MVKGQAALLAWAESCRPQIQPDQFDAVQSDHLRLFVGAGKVLAPPWESVYTSKERLLFQEETLQVREWYHRFGLQAERQYQEPDDHIGLELSFLAQLSGLALQAYEAGDTARFQLLRADQGRFLNEHLARWVPKWCGLVSEHARTGYYRGLALLVKGALEELSQNLSWAPEG
jgi:TorA maturation chaperone TorD